MTQNATLRPTAIQVCDGLQQILIGVGGREKLCCARRTQDKKDAAQICRRRNGIDDHKRQHAQRCIDHQALRGSEAEVDVDSHMDSEAGTPMRVLRHQICPDKEVKLRI